MSMIIDVSDIGTIKKLAAKLAKSLHGGDILAMKGELGAGKTTLTKLILQEAGVAKKITSPTFALMAAYKVNKLNFYHLDLYRLKNYKEAAALGLEELWQMKQNVVIIEWADKIKKYLPKKAVWLEFKVSRQKRQILIKNAKKNFKI